jgi:hypothetical protein
MAPTVSVTSSPNRSWSCSAIWVAQAARPISKGGDEAGSVGPDDRLGAVAALIGIIVHSMQSVMLFFLVLPVVLKG